MFEARKFSQSSYDLYDQSTKDIWISFIKKHGFSITKDEEDYMVDIEAEKDGLVYYFEIESKHGYRFYDEQSFPFDTVSFAGRKKRLCDYFPFWYIIINPETMTAISCHSNVIFNEEYTESLNINSRDRSGMDEFYRVPKQKCKFINLNNYATTKT